MNTHEPAFPRDHRHDGHNGVTVRDYFAAKALQGFAADTNCAWKDGAAGMARCAYDWAEALMAEREKRA